MSIPSPVLTLDALNALDHDTFMQRFGGVYEHSPWVADGAWQHRPYASLAVLVDAFASTLAKADASAQRALILAHPELTGKAAVHKGLTAESAREQRGAGLDACTEAEFEQLQTLNAADRTRFGFPFIVAVTGLGRQDILARLTERVHNTPEVEFATALAQINRIAGFRLRALVEDTDRSTGQNTA